MESRRQGAGFRFASLSHAPCHPSVPAFRTASARVLPEPFAPLRLRSRKGVDVGVALDAVHHAGACVLPEGPGMVRIDVLRVRRHRAQPELVALEMAVEVLAVEIDRGVDDRALAVITTDDVEPGLHFSAHRRRVGALGAGLGVVVPFDIENRRHLDGFPRHTGYEPGGLFGCRAAEVIEVVGCVRDPDGTGLAPVLLESAVLVVAALGRLDEGEGDARALDPVPIDVELIGFKLRS